MRVSITCEDCGQRHRLERRIAKPGPIWIVCHNCELPLQAVLDGPTPAPEQTHAVWAGILNIAIPGTGSTEPAR